MKCVIPCAGESSRMSYVPKHLIRINDKPLITHVVDSWKDVVDSFVFVLKRSQTYMWEYLPENAIVVFQDEPKGLADAILKAEKCIDGRFVVALGDCLHKGRFEESNLDLGIGVWNNDPTDCYVEEYFKSYSVRVEGSRVWNVTEKPTKLDGYCGMGVYFLDGRAFDYIRKYEGPPGGGDFTHILQDTINAGETIAPIWFTGDYTNIGSPEDIKKAEEIFK